MEMIATLPELRIERVPCMFIGVLASEGAIPEPPADILALGMRKNRRKPTPSEAGEYAWVLAHMAQSRAEIGAPVGVLAYQDRFDWHTASDVREVAYVAGSATISLIRWLTANTMKRRVIGAVDVSNTRMMRALAALGHTPTRVMFEDLR